MKRTSFFLSLCTFLLFACQNSSKQAEAPAEPTTAQDHTQIHDHEHEVVSNQVVLNNGEKWPANAETTEGIRKMSTLLNALPAESKLEDYHALKTTLENAYDEIIHKCTMTGEAHNQLHNFILPINEMIQELGSEDATKCKAVVDKLKKHLEEYGNYFQ